MAEKYKMKAIVGQNHFELWQGYEKVRIIGNPIMAFHLEDTLNMETAPLHAEIERLKAENAKLHAGIGELKAALEANKRSSYITWDMLIHEMRGKLQSIHSTATHALNKQESEADNA